MSEPELSRLEEAVLALLRDATERHEYIDELEVARRLNYTDEETSAAVCRLKELGLVADQPWGIA